MKLKSREEQIAWVEQNDDDLSIYNTELVWAIAFGSRSQGEAAWQQFKAIERAQDEHYELYRELSQDEDYDEDDYYDNEIVFAGLSVDSCLFIMKYARKRRWRIKACRLLARRWPHVRPHYEQWVIDNCDPEVAAKYLAEKGDSDE